MENIMVSVYCLAYNHEKYIKDALEGFVRQRTNFAFEVIVHDDASTDSTPTIIKEYAMRHSDIIKPIFQEKNQYSQGIRILDNHILPQMRGKYVAICEGDDFWCDENKLQRQIEFLENHPEYSACVHNTKMFNCRTGETSLINRKTEDCDLNVIDIMSSGNAEFQLSSLVHKRELLYKRPAFCYPKGFSDYPLGIYLAFCGKVRYLADTMSVYRIFSDGSWTSRMQTTEQLRAKLEEHYSQVEWMLSEVDKWSKGIYHDEIEFIKREHAYSRMIKEGNFKEAIVQYPDVLKKQSVKQRIKMYMLVYCPKIITIIKKIKK